MYAYRQRHASTADITDGSWWTANQNELAGMFNGGLDRDNLGPNVITAAMLSSGACVKIRYDLDNGPDAATMTATTWQVLDSFDITPTTDALVEVDWSGTYEWSAGAGWSRATSSDSLTYQVDTVAIRITVNGVTVCESGPTDDQLIEECVALVGSIPVTAGTYTVNVEYLVASRTYYDLAIEGTCARTLNFNERTLITIERRR
jgi:hypothetical protein